MYLLALEWIPWKVVKKYEKRDANVGHAKAAHKSTTVLWNRKNGLTN
jgi:hypothetical protein